METCISPRSSMDAYRSSVQNRVWIVRNLWDRNCGTRHRRVRNPKRKVHMSRRILTSIVLLLLVTTFALGQAKKWTPSRTPDGQPDLQGFWTNSTYTPLERPRNVTKEPYTEAELETLIKKVIT